MRRGILVRLLWTWLLPALIVGFASVNNSFAGLRTGTFSMRSPHKADTIIPTVAKHGALYVVANINRKPLECIVDTGQDIISWPESLALTGKVVGKPFTYHLRDAPCRLLKVILPSMQLGTWKSKNILTYKVLMSRKPGVAVSRDQTGLWHTHMIIGNVLFKHTCVTFDSADNHILIHGTVVPRSLEHQKGAQKLPYLAWGNCISLPGKIEGHSAHLVLDTGCTDMMIPATFAATHLPEPQWHRTQATINVPLTTKSCDEIRNVSVMIGTQTTRFSTATVLPLYDAVHAYVGLPFFRSNRVTIDPIHHWVLICPNAGISAKNPSHSDSTDLDSNSIIQAAVKLAVDQINRASTSKSVFNWTTQDGFSIHFEIETIEINGDNQLHIIFPPHAETPTTPDLLKELNVLVEAGRQVKGKGRLLVRIEKDGNIVTDQSSEFMH